MTNRDSSKASSDDLLRVLRSHDSSDDELCDAAQWLIELGDEKAIETLLHRLDSESDSPWVRRELIIALGSLVLLSSRDHPEVADRLLRILTSSEHEEVRESAALTLGNLGDTRAVVPLLEILESSETGLVYACTAALGSIGDHRALDPLIKLLEADEFLVPQTAAQGLGKLGMDAERALPGLRKLAERGNQTERRLALEAISSIERDLGQKKERTEGNKQAGSRRDPA